MHIEAAVHDTVTAGQLARPLRETCLNTRGVSAKVTDNQPFNLHNPCLEVLTVQVEALHKAYKMTSYNTNDYKKIRVC